jgi:hypothetical protein
MADCPICFKPLAMGKSVIFKDDHLIHAGCWGDKPGDPGKPASTEGPPTAAPPRRSAA